MEKYELTPEHRARLPEYRALGDAIVLRTERQTEEERERCRGAIERMYRLAGLTPPPRERIVFVSSPMVAAFATGAASWIWHCRKQPDGAPAPQARDATGAATWAATGAATRDATGDATGDATRAATRDATWAATWAATGAATRDATGDAGSHWYVGAEGCVAAVLALAGKPGLQCAELAYRMAAEGNHWGGAIAYFNFFRDVAKLPIDWSKWEPWETLGTCGSWRYLHPDFAMICDFPVAVHRDDQNRPHRADGPFIAWPDGVGCYAWHGVRVAAWLIEHPERITVAAIDAEANAEVRRVMIERYGWQRYLKDAGAKVLSEAIDEGGEPMRLLRREVANDEPIVALHLRNSTPDPDGTRREYIVRVPPDMTEVWAARNWTFNLPPETRFGAVS